MSIINSGSDAVYLVNYFSDPDGNTLTYTASSSNATLVEVSIGGVDNSTLTILGKWFGNRDHHGDGDRPKQCHRYAELSPFRSSPRPLITCRDSAAMNSRSSSALVTDDTLIFNELHNGSDDANDWLEFRNMSAANLSA